ncbi:MAG TPA: hypothetical protein VM925_22190 [Labilithrix sp.]|nr:hypothetical protein [Labilithrix sp.]
MTISSSKFLTAVGVFSVLAACTNDESLGGREVARGGYAAQAVAICERSPDHRLNWVYAPEPGNYERKMPAPAGHCAEKTKCLDSIDLDSAVVATVLTCLEEDTDKDKAQSCKEDEVANASSTRPLVTAVQDATAKKRSECPNASLSVDGIAVLSNSALERARACFDKPCDFVRDCLEAFDSDLECIDDLF